MSFFEDEFQRLEKNPNTFSYWYNKVLEKCGNEFKIPRTLVFKTSPNLIRSFFMDSPEEDDERVAEYVKNNIMPNIPEDMFFLFIKNGTYSDKYDGTCFVKKNFHTLVKAVEDINYNALCVGAGGTNEIVIREDVWGMEKQNYPCIYKGLPLVPEFRVFYDFDNRKAIKICNYWDWNYCHEMISREFTDKLVYEAMYPEIEKEFNEHKEEVVQKVENFMKNVEMAGVWSVDIMLRGNIFYLIDMALAENSAYWKD